MPIQIKKGHTVSIPLKEWQTIFKEPSELIVQASSDNDDDAWQPHPIGMSYQYLNMVSLGKDIQIGDHAMLVHCSMRDSTDGTRRRGQPITRRSIIETLKKNCIINTFTSYHDYFRSLPNYKFVISPEGNGIDCHRHYEALMAGCIPIVEDNPQIREKYAGCPILYTKRYSDISESFLQAKYAEMLDTPYDFSCLFLSHYTEDQQKQMKASGNYWIQKLVGKTKYYE
jgi:hypothetical protein